MVTSLDFAPNLKTIANNPAEVLSRFRKIDETCKKQYGCRTTFLVAGLGIALLSVAAADFGKWVVGSLGVAGAFCFYKSVDVTYVETEDYSKQQAAIKQLFDPPIEKLRKAFQAKAESIYYIVNDVPANTLEEVKAKIDSQIEQYDKTSDQALKEIQDACVKIAAFDLTTIPQDLDPYASRGMKTLKETVTQYLRGDQKSSSLGEDSYVRYGLRNQKARIDLTFALRV